MALERLALRRGAPSAAHGGRTDSAFLALQRRALFGGRPPLTLRTPWPVAPLVGGARAAGARLPSSSASDALHHNHHQQQQAYSSKRPKAPTAAAAAAAGDVVEGIVRSVTFASDSGFRVLRVELDAATLQRLQLPKSHLAKHSRNQVVVTGMLHDVVEGMLIRVTGSWGQHSKYGHQFAASAGGYEELPNTNPAGLALRLQQSLAGCGEVRSQLLVEAFGSSVMDVLDSPDAEARLQQVKGIGAKRAAKFKQAWDASRSTRNAVTALRDLGLGTALAQRVAKRYKARALELLSDDPYRCLWGVRGGGFRVADALATRLGKPPDHPSRGACALLQALFDGASRGGHTYLTWDDAKGRALALMAGATGPGEWPCRVAPLERCMDELARRGRACVEPAYAPLSAASLCSWAPLHNAERAVATKLTQLVAKGSRSQSDAAAQRKAAGSWLDGYEKRIGIRFTSEQREAVLLAAAAPVMALTGAAGCGKTFATQAIVQMWLDQGLKVSICAPTGRAANRLQEVVQRSGLPAYTIHRLLGYTPRGKSKSAAAAGGGGGSGGLEDDDALELLDGDDSDDEGGGGEGRMAWCFKHNESYPLQADAVLVDEASMLDVQLAQALLVALPEKCRLVVVGDANQLPPVGPGSVLPAMLAAPHIKAARLTVIQRQQSQSAIIGTAHSVMAGSWPDTIRRASSLAEIQQLIRTRLTTAAPAGSSASSSAPARGAAGCAAPPRLLLDGTDAVMVVLPNSTPPDALEASAAQLVVELAGRGVDVHRDVQVLSPQRRGTTGCRTLNPLLQPIMNPLPGGGGGGHHQRNHKPPAAAATLATGLVDDAELLAWSSGQQQSAAAAAAPHVWRLRDRVVHNVNDYDKDVYNGDLGTIVDVDERLGTISVRYLPRPGQDAPHVVTYIRSEQSDVEPAWATTVHKAQGGEFPVVVLPLHHYAWHVLLSRPMLYTSVTRARQLLVLLTTESALRKCLANAGDVRNTTLLQRLVEFGVEAQLVPPSAAAAVAGAAPTSSRSSSSAHVDPVDPVALALSHSDIISAASHQEASDAEDILVSMGMSGGGVMAVPYIPPPPQQQQQQQQLSPGPRRAVARSTAAPAPQQRVASSAPGGRQLNGSGARPLSTAAPSGGPSAGLSSWPPRSPTAGAAGSRDNGAGAPPPTSGSNRG